MKKLVIATAIVCLGTASAFAAPAPKVQLKPETRVGAPKSGQLGQQKLGSSKSNMRTNMGAPAAQPIAGAGSNILSEAAKSSVAEKLGSTCQIAGLSSAQIGTISQAKIRGLSSTTCLDKFASDASVQQTAQQIIAAQNDTFTSLGVKDRNSDGKTSVSDLNASERATILKAGANTLAGKLGISQDAALERLEATVTEGCDIVSSELAAGFKAL